MNINKLSDEAAITTVNEICDGLKSFISRNPDSAHDLLRAMKDGFLDDLAENDYFGTEGWEHGLGVS
jgi:hypothetical protein